MNDGPILICKSFLDTPSVEDKEQVPKLQSLLQDFLILCKEALVVNKRLITSDQIDFHKALEEGYSKLQKEMAKYHEMVDEILHGRYLLERKQYERLLLLLSYSCP